MRRIRYILPLLAILLWTCKTPQLTNTSIVAQPDFAESPKNIILLIGDGMGLGQISAAILDKDSPSVFELFKHIGLQKTHAVNNLITDSAAAATAIACGKKTYRNAIGMDKDTVACQSILEEAELKNLSTGVVVTSSLVHATPGSFYSHVPLRSLYEYIALDLFNNKIDFAVGGGRKYFDQRSVDERNLIKDMKEAGYLIGDFNNAILRKIGEDTQQPVVMFTGENRPNSVLEGRDYLPYASFKAMNYLKNRVDEGFFLLIEGSQIDWAGHANEAANVLREMHDFEETIYEVLKFASQDKETLVIVTADHETGGLAINPKSKRKRLKLEFTTNNHTGTMVPVFAYGPKAELFEGIYDNTAIYHKMREAFGWEKQVLETMNNTLQK